MANATAPQAEYGNRRKVGSGVLTGGIRADLDPTELESSQMVQAGGVVATPRGLERVNAYASAAALSTKYPIYLTEVGTPDGPIESGTIEIINDDGTVTYAGSTTDLYYELENVGITNTISGSGTLGTLPASVSVDGVSYIYDGYETLNLRPGDIVVDINTALVGSGLAIATVGAPALATLSSTRVAFIDDTNDSLRAYDWNGSAWSLTGSGLAIATVTNPALAALSSSRVAFIDDTNDSLRAYDFNGSTWSLTGSGLAISSVVRPALCALSSTDVVLADSSTFTLRVYRFNGSTWSQVGNTYTLGSLGEPSLATLDSTHFALRYNTDFSLQTYRWDGTNFYPVGAKHIDTGLSGTTSICALSETDIAFMDGFTDTLRRFEFNGNVWREVAPSFSVGTVGESALAFLTGTDVAFIDASNDSLRTYRFAGPSSPRGVVVSTEGRFINFAAGTTLADGALTNWSIRYKATPTTENRITALWDSTEFDGIPLVSALDRPFAQIDIGGYVTAKNRGTAFSWPVSGVASDVLFAITARTIEVFQNFIFIACTREQYNVTSSTIYPNRVRWSSAFEPLTDWTNVLSFLDVPNANGDIVKLLTNKQFLMAYCENGIFYGQLSGDPNVPVVFQELNTDNTGLVGVRAICQAKQIHFFCGRENVYMMQGLTVTAIGDPIVQQTLRQCTNASYIQMVYDARKQRILVGFPIADSANIDVVYALSLETQAWTLAFTRSTKILTNAQSSRLQGVFTTNDIYITSVSGGNYTLLKEQSDSTVPAASTGVEVTLETPDLTGSNLGQIKEFFGVWVKVGENRAAPTARTASILFTVAISVNHGITYRQVGTLRVLPNKQEGYLTFRATSNHIRLKFTSTSLVAPYALVSYSIDVKGMEATESLITQGIIGGR